jgi:hypothetical protein
LSSDARIFMAVTLVRNAGYISRDAGSWCFDPHGFCNFYTSCVFLGYGARLFKGDHNDAE